MFTQVKRTNKQIIHRKNEKELDVKLQLGTGKLSLNGDTEEIMEGSFTIKGDSIEPEVQYETSELEKGNLVISQRSVNTWKSFRSVKQEWQVAINPELPLALKLELGVGTSELDLSKLNLKELKVESGVGESIIDLSGDWKESFNVKMDTGVGKTKILLPKHLGVKMDIEKGIGKIDADYFMMVGDSYQNQAYENAEVKIDIHLNIGVGGVNIEQK